MTTEDRSLWPRILRLVLRLAVIAGLVWLTHLTILWVVQTTAELQTIGGAARTLVLVMALAGYALLLAIPFVPGVEVGIGLLMLQGAAIAPYVYGATVAGLTLAFLVGRYMPLGWLIGTFADLGLTRAAGLVSRIGAATPAERIALLHDRVPGRFGRIALRYRYVMLALLINLPGTALIGGGGGVMTLAGLSRAFALPWVILTIIVATLPVPLGVWLLGSQIHH